MTVFERFPHDDDDNHNDISDNTVSEGEWNDEEEEIKAILETEITTTKAKSAKWQTIQQSKYYRSNRS